MPHQGRKRKESKECWHPNKYCLYNGLNVIMYLLLPLKYQFGPVTGACGTDDGYPTEILDHG